MTRTQKSQLKEILLQLTELKGRLNTTLWEVGEDMSTHEEITIKRTIAELSSAIKHLTEVI